MAHRLPIVASNTGGLPDKVFEDGPYHNGWLVRPGNAADLAARLKLMLSLAPEKRRDLGENSRKLVLERFSWREAAAQTVALYQSLLQQKK
jgi:glycosyltransferase involved in cell wall biosynthesis